MQTHNENDSISSFSDWKKTNLCSSYVSLNVTKDAILLLCRKRTAMSAVTFDIFLLKYFALHLFFSIIETLPSICVINMLINSLSP